MPFYVPNCSWVLCPWLSFIFQNISNSISLNTPEVTTLKVPNIPLLIDVRESHRLFQSLISMNVHQYFRSFSKQCFWLSTWHPVQETFIQEIRANWYQAHYAIWRPMKGKLRNIWRYETLQNICIHFGTFRYGSSGLYPNNASEIIQLENIQEYWYQFRNIQTLGSGTIGDKDA